MTEDNEFALDPIPAETVAAEVAATDVLMVRDPKAGGKGVIRMLVPASQVADFEKAGWSPAK